MAEMFSLAVAPRDDSVTTKALRRAGLVPAVVYGRDFAAQSVQIGYRLVERAVYHVGTSSVLTLDIEGQPQGHMVLVRDIQRDPVSSRILHVDFYRIVAGERIRSTVPVVLVGSAPVVELVELGAVVSHVLSSIEIECLPKDMPRSVQLDISGLVDVHDSISVGELTVPEEVLVLTPPDAVVVQVMRQRGVAEEEEEEVAEAELEEGAEVEEEKEQVE